MSDGNVDKSRKKEVGLAKANVEEFSNHKEEEALISDIDADLSTNNNSDENTELVLRCDRCGDYETVDEADFSVHRGQCLPRGETNKNMGNEENEAGMDDHKNKLQKKSFECDVCFKKFANGPNMRRHKMRHTGVKPFECRVCKKRFSRKDHLVEHCTTHLRLFPYRCPVCNRGFRRPIAMRAHLQHEHAEEQEKAKTCPFCPFRAPTMDDLRVHFLSSHGADLNNPHGSMDRCTLSEFMSFPPPLSDSGDSMENRSADNATPPLHFLTPQIEISFPPPDQNANLSNVSSSLINGDGPVSPQSADSNSNATSDSHHFISPIMSSLFRGIDDKHGRTPPLEAVPNVKISSGSENGLDLSQADVGESNHGEDEGPDPEITLNTSNDNGDKALAFRCDRCDDYETTNGAEFSAHQDQCQIVREPRENAESSENDAKADDQKKKSHKKMFQCDICSVFFSNGPNMRRHKMRHSGVKPFECRVCKKRFFRKDHLAEHSTTHSKTLPFHCPICNRGFQRQIAMRAHFQNEHVGQHDMIKSCQLCQYRASTIEDLRLHFFNGHGIDLDNQRPNGSKSNRLPGEAMSFAPPLSDSGDSTGNRSADNSTPPLHFLTPQVEISFPPPEQNNASPALINGDGPISPQSADSDSAPSDSHRQSPANSISSHGNASRNRDSITPSISLIPIKLEPGSNGLDDGGATSMNLSLPPLTKESPLKSLLRDDLRRKLSSTSNNNNNNNSGNSNIALGQPLTSTRPEARASCLQCTYCRITFPDQTLYFMHKGCHSENNPWKCNICGEQCCSVYQFNSHLLSKSHQ